MKTVATLFSMTDGVFYFRVDYLPIIRKLKIILTLYLLKILIFLANIPIIAKFRRVFALASVICKANFCINPQLHAIPKNSGHPLNLLPQPL